MRRREPRARPVDWPTQVRTLLDLYDAAVRRSANSVTLTQVTPCISDNQPSRHRGVQEGELSIHGFGYAHGSEADAGCGTP